MLRPRRVCLSLRLQLLLRLQRGAGNAQVTALIRSGALMRAKGAKEDVASDEEMVEQDEEEGIEQAESESEEEEESARKRKREDDESDELPRWRKAKLNHPNARVPKSPRQRAMKGLKGRGPASVRRPRFGPSKGHRKPGDRHREPLYRGGRVAWTDLGAQLDQSATRQAQHEKKEKKLKTARDWVKVTGTGKQRRKEYRCVDCDKWFPREEAKRPDDLSDITLDHVKAWAELKTELPTHTWLDDDGHEWTGYLQNDASAEYNDIDNLRPMCQSCNSVRGSDPKNKVYDSNFDPTHDPKTCPECTKDS